MSFLQTFGGDTLNPAYLSYAAYSTAVSLTLQWPFEAQSGANILAAKIDVNATAAGLSVSFPDATLVSVGQDALVRNTGSNSFTILSADGTTLGTVASGEAWYFYLTSNAAVGGTWDSVQFGAGTSTASAASLAGAGLLAVLTRLNQNLLSQAKSGNYAPVAGDLATVLRGTGGAVVYSPSSAATLGNGWFVYVINAGSGSLTWTPSGGQTVDGAATKVLNPTESAIFFSDGSNFWTLGYGRSVSSTVTGVTINIAGTGAFTLSAPQVAAQVQNYVGALTGNRILNYGTGVGYWFVYNNTTGAFTTTFRVNGSDPGVTVAQGVFSILRSDGSNMSTAFSGAVGTVTSVATTANLTGGPITTAGTLDLSDTTVTPATYGAGLSYPSITVDQKGRITGATTVALGSAAGLTAGAAAGNVPVLDASALVPSANGGASTGDIKFNVGSSLAGWVLSNGLTIGNATSGGTLRANADTVNLFTLLWNSWANAQAAVSGGRGGSAAADYAANKTIAVPDLRGLTLAAMDIMGGSANANRLSTILASTTPGASGGAQTETATVNSSGTNNINFGAVAVSGATIGLSDNTAQAANGVDFTASTNAGHFAVSGATSAINGNFGITVSGTTASATNVQPTMVMNVFIKL